MNQQNGNNPFQSAFLPSSISNTSSSVVRGRGSARFSNVFRGTSNNNNNENTANRNRTTNHSQYTSAFTINNNSNVSSFSHSAASVTNSHDHSHTFSNNTNNSFRGSSSATGRGRGRFRGRGGSNLSKTFRHHQGKDDIHQIINNHQTNSSFTSMNNATRFKQHGNISKTFNSTTPLQNSKIPSPLPTPLFTSKSLNNNQSISRTTEYPKRKEHIRKFNHSFNRRNSFDVYSNQDELNSSQITEDTDLNQYVVHDPVSGTMEEDDQTSTTTSLSFKQKNTKVVLGSKDITKEDRATRFSSKPQDNKYDELKQQRDALRKKYIREGKIADPENSQYLSDALVFVGECEDMCSEFERYEREIQMGLDPLEKISGTDLVDHARAVKRFRRSAAGDEEPLPCDVRPPRVLIKTLDYLIYEILGEHGLEKSYAFVRDRARAIRKDFFLQNYRGIEAVECHERIARYHILCSHVLCENTNVSLQQEHEQMRKTLQSLREYYVDLAKEGIYSPNEAEFQAYYILSHLFQNEFVSRAESLRPEVFDHPYVQLALEFHALAQRANEYARGHSRTEGSLNAATRFFRLIADPGTPYLIASILHMSFVSIRKGALKAMQKAFYCLTDQISYTFDLEYLVAILGLDTPEEVIEHLDYYEIPYETNVEENGSLCISSSLNHKNNDIVVYIGRIVDPTGAKAKRKGLLKEDHRASFPPKVSRRLIQAKRADLSEVDIIEGCISHEIESLDTYVAKFVGGDGYTQTMIQAATSNVQAVSPRSASIVDSESHRVRISTGMPTQGVGNILPMTKSTSIQNFAQLKTPISENRATSTTNEAFAFTPQQHNEEKITSPTKLSASDIVTDDDILLRFVYEWISEETISIAENIYQEALMKYEQALQQKIKQQMEERKRMKIEQERQRQATIEFIKVQTSIEMSESILHEYVSSFVYGNLKYARDVRSLQNAYLWATDQLVQSVVYDIVKETVLEHRAKLMVNSVLKRRVLKKWRFALKVKQEKKKVLKQKLEHFLMNTKELTGFAPLFDGQQGEHVDDMRLSFPDHGIIQRVNVFGLPIRGPIHSYQQKHGQDEEMNHVKSPLKKIELAMVSPLSCQETILGHLIYQIQQQNMVEGPWQVYFKFAISTFSLPSETNYIDSFIHQWLFRQLTQDMDENLVNRRESTVSMVYRSPVEHTRYGYGIFHSCAQLLNTSLLQNLASSDYEHARLHNADAPCSAPSLALFVFRLYSPVESIKEYLDEECDRLTCFLSQIPSNAQVPLLMAVPTTKLLDVSLIQDALLSSELDENSYLELKTFLKQKTNGNTLFLSIPVANPEDLSFEFHELEIQHKIVHGLDQVLSSSLNLRNPFFMLSSDLFGLISKGTYAHFLCLLESMSDELNVEMRDVVPMINFWIQLFNLQLDVIQWKLFNKMRCEYQQEEQRQGQQIEEVGKLNEYKNSLVDIVWPPTEFFEDIGIKVNWNSTQTLSSHSQRLELFKISLLSDFSPPQHLSKDFVSNSQSEKNQRKQKQKGPSNCNQDDFNDFDLNQFVHKYLLDTMINIPHFNSKHVQKLQDKISIIFSDGFDGVVTIKHVVRTLTGFVVGLLKQEIEAMSNCNFKVITRSSSVSNFVFPLELGKQVVEWFGQESDRLLRLELSNYQKKMSVNQTDDEFLKLNYSSSASIDSQHLSFKSSTSDTSTPNSKNTDHQTIITNGNHCMSHNLLGKKRKTTASGDMINDNNLSDFKRLMLEAKNVSIQSATFFSSLS